eukprot:CAMPEP_0114620738 /NCGR_PEP_ID=MMETSP0168-20121206/8878_1 /TAXON_ID=95228 ORGANISM="Vannella sp., Strain DIVA3 517/6/12" /NCGR_SAMPLE_ID=MMETSP0168 /ASSEMBLY_ACC=CAM_ASM_000044 /LENGTH=124 /DNA_ID=CAMNT_0001831935 /DNA_START=102 /DNA_END=473 /DNA_ORIENTATION=-
MARQERKRKRSSDRDSAAPPAKKKKQSKRKRSLVSRLDSDDDLRDFIVDEDPYANDSDDDDFGFDQDAELQEVLSRFRRGRKPDTWNDDESSDECMVAGYDDVEAEERRSSVIGSKEDRRALRE